MTVVDLSAVQTLAERVHVDYPEDAAVFAERLALFPGGCYVLTEGADPVGYMISHPWRYMDPPKLNTLLGALPPQPTTYYIHDVAILPAQRGTRKAREIVATCVGWARAHGFTNMSLVAVNRTAPYWRDLGFQPIVDSTLNVLLKSYDGAATFMARRLTP